MKVWLKRNVTLEEVHQKYGIQHLKSIVGFKSGYVEEEHVSGFWLVRDGAKTYWVPCEYLELENERD